ncbi:aprataxin and PNK-like factor isoform X1 [Varanus komodoensis]|uniref:Aprataxin and PNKP like factor n=1 Tax=Varanus komodoensis TaxID=61221 RepID=A0A8D2JAH5_VARKO|nr:aprataxin and PNK-like factor isoform X1 [Varanus komodoensis]
MPGFELEPVAGGCPVTLPPGETVIGRGALLGVTDKRVSRKHAILKVDGDQLSIKPVHVNPCFYQPNKNGQLLPLDTNKWHRLSPGDNFSLLVDKYAFRVIFTPSEVKSLLRKSCNPSVEDGTSQTPSTLQPTKMPCQQPSEQQIASSISSQLLEVHSVLEKAAEIPKKFSASISENEKTRPTQRKRVLPEWMLQANLMVQSPSISVPGRGNNEETNKPSRKKQKRSASEDVAVAAQDVQVVSTEPVLENLEKNENKIVPQRAGSSKGQHNHQLENEELDLDLEEQACQPSETAARNTGKNKLDNVSFTTKQAHQDNTSQSFLHQSKIQEHILNQASEADTSNLTEGQNVPQSSNVARHQRTACRYGKSCYRKNPIHLQEFSHPGDSDYCDTETLSQIDNDNRPECPYGTACYRKNPQHKLEYKHTAPPESERRQTRQRVVKKGRGALEDDDDGGEPNEYDLNDSFIDDEEEEDCDPTDEDSDWEPDSQEKDDEDVDTLLEEAENFVKTKK